MGPIVRKLPDEPWEKRNRPRDRRQEDHGTERQQFMPMGLAKMEPGVKFPPHRHGYTQVFYILEGSGQVVVDGHAYDVGPGSVARFVHGEEHTVINPGPSPLSLIEVRVLPRGQTVWE
jgi:mannose-6-phosphate isomerase-like protein (cupin superfamily)